MLLHMTPKLYSPFREVDLIDWESKELGIRLEGGKDLDTRHPYPNKWYSVACRKQGQKAINGFLIETPGIVDLFQTTARWAVGGKIVVTHKVSYRLLDREFDAASEDMMMWYATWGKNGWKDRRPLWWTDDAATAQSQPRMDVRPEDSREGAKHDIIDIRTGWIVSRHETFDIPTIERERLAKWEYDERLPAIGSAFKL